MSTINKQPGGLLGFLGIKNGGRAPGTLSDFMAPTWDLQKMYLDAYAEYITQFSAIAGTGPLTYFQVPANQYWYVSAFGVRVLPAPAEVIDVQAALVAANLSAIVPAGPSTGTITGIPAGACFLSQPVFLGPGESLGIWTHRFTAAGTITGNGYARITRMSA